MYMLERERKDIILRLLSLHTYANIHDIVEATGASEATIRRDFVQLENESKLKRVRGGVELVLDNRPATPPQTVKPSMDSRKSVNREKKRRIAKQACSLLTNGETIIIDGGSTTFHMVEYLTSMSLQVVTNSFAVAEYLVKHSQCTVIIPEGTINPSSQLILNNLSADPFANYFATKAFMGIEGITETNLTNSETLIIQTERAMIAHTQEVIILADETKFGQVGSLTLCPVERASRIITTRDADPRIVSILREKNIEIIQI